MEHKGIIIVDEKALEPSDIKRLEELGWAVIVKRIGTSVEMWREPAPPATMFHD
jgi:hypothetical protein